MRISLFRDGVIATLVYYKDWELFLSRLKIVTQEYVFQFLQKVAQLDIHGFNREVSYHDASNYLDSEV